MKKLCLIVTALIVVMTGAAFAQVPDTFTNLKVLDTAISHDELLGVMRSFTSGLGVKCGFCHVPKKEPGTEGMDFASDDSEHKQVARQMLVMTKAINADFIAKLDSPDGTHIAVQCVTCHRGQPEPRLIQDVLQTAYTKGGADSAIAKYSALREKYFGRHTYDFSDQVLNGLAMDVAREDAAGAIRILDLNKQFYPQSSYVYFTLGQVYLLNADTVKAIENLQQSVTLGPQNERAAELLKSLQP